MNEASHNNFQVQLENEVIAIENPNAPFTEIFSILRYCILSEKSSANVNQICIIQSHIENAMQALLSGVADLGTLIGIVASNGKKYNIEISNFGFLISLLGNLSEALHCLQSDLIYQRQTR